MKQAVRYEKCCVCGENTDKAGIGDDSLYCDTCDAGPFCEQCWDEHKGTEEECEKCQASGSA